MPKYSIIVPVYKAERTIEECVNSVLSQTVQDFELLLVDDNSPDQSLKECKRLQEKDNRIQVFHQPTNKGVSAARNRGLDAATGEFVLFIDSDDFVSEDYLSIIDAKLSEKDYDLLSFGMAFYYNFEGREPNTVISTMNCSVDAENPNAEDWYTLCLTSFFASPCNKAYKRSVIDANGIRFDEKCVSYEDFIFNCQYCNFIQSFLIIDNPLYYYRQISDAPSAVKRDWGTIFEISRKVVDVADEFINNHREFDLKDVRRHALQSYHIELEYAYSQGKETFQRAVYEACNDPRFIEVLRSIRPQGKFIPVLRLAARYNFKKLQILLVRYMISKG